MAYTAWSVVFGEQPSAAKWNILGTNDAYFDSIIGSGAAWTSWTPTLSGRLNNTKWNKACKYVQLGKTVIAKLSLVANTTTPMDGGTADAIFTLPVTAAALSLTANIQNLGTISCFDASGTVYPSHAYLASTTTALVRAQNAAATNVIIEIITSAVPFTWTTTDEIGGIFIYEAA